MNTCRMEVDCLRLDFGTVPGTNLPRFSIAVIGNSRQDVQGWRAFVIGKMGMQPRKETWMSAPDEDPFANGSDEMEDEECRIEPE